MKKLIAVCGAAICALFMCACLDVCAGVFGFSLLFCTAASGNKETSYTYMYDDVDTYDSDDWAQVQIDLVTAEPESISEEGHWVGYRYISEAQVGDNEAFLEDFRTLMGTHPFGPPMYSGYGRAIRFVYPDGTSEVITACGSGLFSVDNPDRPMGYHYMLFEEAEFSAFWEKWAQQEASQPAEEETDAVGTVLMDSRNILITQGECGYDGSDYAMELNVDNSSGKDIRLECDRATVNGWVMDMDYEAGISDGQSLTLRLELMEYYLDLCGITEVDEVVLHISAENEDSGKNVLNGNITLYPNGEDEEGALYVRQPQEGEMTVQETDDVTVIAEQYYRDVYGFHVLLYVGNNSGGTKHFSINEVIADGWKVKAGTLSLEMPSGSRARRWFTVTADRLAECGFSEAPVSMKFITSDGESQTIYFNGLTAEDVSVPEKPHVDGEAVLLNDRSVKLVIDRCVSRKTASFEFRCWVENKTDREITVMVKGMRTDKGDCRCSDSVSIGPELRAYFTLYADANQVTPTSEWFDMDLEVREGSTTLLEKTVRFSIDTEIKY